MSERYINADLKPLFKKLEIFTKKKMPSLGLEGSYQSTFRGRGMEFKEYTNYTTDVDASRIDWRASLRSGDLLIREFIEERNLNIMVLIDVGDSMIFGSKEKLKCEYAAEVAANIGFVVLRSEDAFGFAMYGDKMKAQIVPRIGNKQMFYLTQELLNPDNYGGTYKFSRAAKDLSLLLPVGAVVMLLSDFMNLDKDPGWDTWLKTLSAKYDIIGINIRDERDRKLPDKKLQLILSGVGREQNKLIDTKSIAPLYEAYVKKQEEEIHQTFRSLGCDFVSLEVGKPFTDQLMRVFTKRV